jgi:hypothetical protein
VRMRELGLSCLPLNDAEAIDGAPQPISIVGRGVIKIGGVNQVGLFVESCCF